MKSLTKVLQRVPLALSKIQWHYLCQVRRKTWLDISKMKSCGKYSKAKICTHIVKNIGHVVVDKWKQNQGRPTKLSERQKRNILHQAKVLQGRSRKLYREKRNAVGWYSNIN